MPTFRPDAVVYLDRAGWQPSVAALAELAGIDTSTYAGYLDALRAAPRRPSSRPARLATDHGH